MRRYKKRLEKKWFKRVSIGIATGQPIPRFYIQRVFNSTQYFIDTQYLNVFRPWWYDHMEEPSLEFITEYKRHFGETIQKFRELSGIDLREFDGIVKASKPEKIRKPRIRKQKPPVPIRKLRNPEQFKIRMNNGEATVLGERVFSISGHDFFIHLYEGPQWNLWIVSDVETGIKVFAHEQYKKAVSEARAIITRNFDSYVQAIKKIKGDTLTV